MDKPILQARAVFIYIALVYILITVLVESIPLGLKIPFSQYTVAFKHSMKTLRTE